MANLAAVLDDTSSNGKKIKQIYDDLKLSMTGANGQMKSGYELLSDLAGEWSGLSSDTQKYIATTIAGTTQLNNFVALMNNFGHATKATETALDSAGSAAEENARYMGGLEAQTTAVKAEFESLANNVIPNELISAFLKAGKAILSFANTDLGAVMTRFALVGSVVLGGGNIILGYVAKIKELIVALKATSGAMATLQASLGWVALALGVVAAILPTVIDAWNDSHKSISQLAADYNDYNNQLQTNYERLAEINKMPWSDRTSEINKEYLALKQQNDELERNKALTADKILQNKKFDTVEIGTQYEVLMPSYYDTGLTPGQAAEEGALYDRKIVDSIEEALELQKKLRDEGYDATIETQKIYAHSLGEVVEELQNYDKILTENGELTAWQNDNYIELANSSYDYYESLVTLKNQGRVLTDEQQEFIDVYERVNAAYIKAEASADLFGMSLNDVKSLLPELASYLDKSGWSINSIGAYCQESKQDVDKFADSLFGAAIAAAELQRITAQAEYNKLGIGPSGAGLRKYQPYAEAENLVNQLTASREKLKKNLLEYNKTASKTNLGTGDTKTLTQAEKNLQEFRSQLAYLDHDLAMNNINTEQYYYHLQQLMDAYLQDAENVETLWKYQEKIYKHSQEELQNYYQEQLDQQNALIDKINERFDAEIEGLEKSNDELEKQIEYEQLLEDMASAKAKKSLVFKNGAFQYVEDVDAISSAQNALRKYYRQQEVEQRKQNIEAARQRELYEPQQLVSRLEEIIKNIKGYATGTTYSAGGLSLVGEHGAELAVLSKGTGVIPADITKNLWAWGQTTPSALMSTVAGVNTQNGGIYFSGVTMSFPSVRNGNDAQSFMQSVVNLAYQRAYSRK